MHSLDLFLIYLVVGEDACPDMWRFCHGVSGVEILALERWRKEDQKFKAVLTMDLVALVLLHLSECGVFLHLGPTQKQRPHPISQVLHGVVLSPLREHHIFGLLCLAHGGDLSTPFQEKTTQTANALFSIPHFSDFGFSFLFTLKIHSFENKMCDL